ncbi:MAG: hypothetical protein U1E15_12690, partial [Hyphomicrobiales bacterium]
GLGRETESRLDQANVLQRSGIPCRARRIAGRNAQRCALVLARNDGNLVLPWLGNHPTRVRMEENRHG